MAVKMDYKDDIFSGQRKYSRINNSDGTISLDDATVYQQVGDTFGAGDMNNLAAAINGFQTKKTFFNEDGSISEKDSLGYVKQTFFNEDESITETLRDEKENLIATKLTEFDEEITETVT